MFVGEKRGTLFLCTLQITILTNLGYIFAFMVWYLSFEFTSKTANVRLISLRIILFNLFRYLCTKSPRDSQLGVTGSFH